MSDIISRPLSAEGRANFDRIFRKPAVASARAERVVLCRTDTGVDIKGEALEAVLGMNDWVDARIAEHQAAVQSEPQAEKAPEKAPEQVIEVPMCELQWIVPRPGQLYRFHVVPDCTACKRAAGPYANDS